MSRSFKTFTVAAVLLCAFCPANAEIRDRGFEVSGFGGIQSGDNKENVASGSSFGLRLAYAITPRIMIEGVISSFRTEREITGFAGPRNEPANQVEFDQIITSTDFLYYGVGLTANFRTDLDVKIIPYLNFGIGVVVEEREGAQFCVDLRETDLTHCSDFTIDGVQKDPTNTQIDPTGIEIQIFVPAQDTGSLISPGAGFRFFLTPSLAGRFDVHYNHHDSFNVNQDAFEASLGFSYIFGGRR